MRAAIICLALGACAAAGASASPLAVCADPNNLPFSNDKGEGFENRIVELIASDLGRPIQWVWVPQRRGYLRETIRAGECDLVPGTPATTWVLRTTRPYYRSSYVFVTRADEPPIASFDDPRLRQLRIGVQLVGDGATPPAAALSARGIVQNVRGYPVWGDYGKPNPGTAIMQALENGEIDVAAVWGPLGGWYARITRMPMKATQISAKPGERTSVSFAISMGTRKGTPDLVEQVQAALENHQGEIVEILEQFGVPLAGHSTGN